MSISYTPTTWIDNDTLVDATKLNNIEGGVQAACDAVDGLATVATSGSYDDLTDTPSLATVATSGSYADLSNKPTNFVEDTGDTMTGSLTIDPSASKAVAVYITNDGGGYINAEVALDGTPSIEVSGSTTTLTLREDNVSGVDDLTVDATDLTLSGSNSLTLSSGTNDIAVSSDMQTSAGTTATFNGAAVFESSVTANYGLDVTDGNLQAGSIFRADIDNSTIELGDANTPVTATYNGSEIALKSDLANSWEVINDTGVSVASGADYMLYHTPTKSGYTAVGVLGYRVGGAYGSYCITSSIFIDSGTINWTIHNTASSTATAKFYAAVLWQKD